MSVTVTSTVHRKRSTPPPNQKQIRQHGVRTRSLTKLTKAGFGSQIESNNGLNQVQTRGSARRKKDSLLCGCVDLLYCTHQNVRKTSSKKVDSQQLQKNDKEMDLLKMRPLKSCLIQRSNQIRKIWDFSTQPPARTFFLFLIGLFFGMTALSWRWLYSSHVLQSLEDLEVSDESIKKVARWMQVQVELIDNKIETEITTLKKKLEEKIAKEAMHVENELQDNLQRMDRVGSSVETLLEEGRIPTKTELSKMIQLEIENRVEKNGGRALSFEDLSIIARKVIKSELEKYRADGLARIDFAIESGGGHVVDHSEGYFLRRGQWSFSFLNLFPAQHHLHPYASKVLQPSLGEPGQCLPLKGSNVWVDIALRTSILAEAVTLEHVARSIAFDLSSAPKDFQIFGWHEVKGSNKGLTKHRLLGEFRYDLMAPAIQTFDLSIEESASGFINMIRLHVLSNYGSPTHTCIYRLRVHGTDPWMPAVPVF